MSESAASATTPCVLCGEPLGARGWWADEVSAQHRACALRSVVGGIGHLEDHALWCTVRGDPDGGRSFYQSALEVDEWIAQHGLDAALARG